MEATRRASLADEEARRIRPVESVAGASSSIDMAISGGTGNTVVADEDTAEGIQTTKVVGFGEPNPPSCCSSALCAPGLHHLPLSYFIFLCIRDNCMSFLGGGVNFK